MTLRTNARLAGLAFLLYIVAGISSLVLSNQATRGAEGTAAKLASMAQHAATIRLTVLLTLFTFVCAVVLAVTLYALTREEDRDLAMMGLCCRLSEAVLGANSAVRALQLLAVATATTAAAATDAATTQAFGALLLKQGGWSGSIGATCFALGSTLYCYLFLRARSIPALLAWLGVVASVLLVVALPMQLAGFLEGSVAYFVWLPMLVFEVTFAFWLIIKGVALPANRQSATAING